MLGERSKSKACCWLPRIRLVGLCKPCFGACQRVSALCHTHVALEEGFLQLVVECSPQVREELYQTLGALAGQVSAFYAASAAAPAWAAALVGDLPHLRDAHVRLLMRHVLRPLIRACPPAHRYLIRIPRALPTPSVRLPMRYVLCLLIRACPPGHR